MKVTIGEYGDDREVSVHIDEWDTWDMDRTLALIILPMLKQLKTTKHGVPSSVFENSTWDVKTDEDVEKANRNWDFILDKMIFSFEQLVDVDEGEEQFWITKPVMDLEDHPEDEGKTSSPIRWKVPGELDMKAMANHRRQIQEGLELFGKHFRDLWD